MKKWVINLLVAIAVFSSQLSTGLFAASACNWSCYGGNKAGTNSASDECAPVGDKLETAWNIHIDAPILSQPAIDEGKIYFGTFKNIFYCLEQSTGKVIWEAVIGGSVYSTPCVDDENVYICSWDRKAYCFDKNTGAKKWSFGTELYIFNSPMLYSNWLFIGSRDERLYCVSPKTGAKQWDIKTGAITSTPVIGNSMVYLGEHDGTVYCIDPVKRTIVWEVKKDGIIESSIAFSKDHIFVGYTGENESSFLCLDAKTGKQVWAYKANSGLWSDPCIGDGKCFVSSENNIFAFDENTGKLLWTDTQESGRFSQAVYCKKRLYYGTTGKGFFVKDSDTGETIYNLPIKSAVRTPAISDRKIYFGCEDGSVYCVSGQTEKVVSLEISPLSATLPPNASLAFTLQAKMNTGLTNDATNKASWNVKDPSIGKIDHKGNFTAISPGTTEVTATYENLTVKSLVKVTHFIRVNPNPIVFKDVRFGSKASLDINFENLIDKEIACKLVPSDASRLSAAVTSLKVPINGVRTQLVFDSSGIAPGTQLNYLLKVEYDGGWLEIPVKANISNQQVPCLRFEPYMLDFGYVSRGSTKTVQFMIHYEGIKTKGTFRPMHNWIEIKPDQFDSEKPEQVYDVTIASSALPSGDTFGSMIKLEQDEPMCESASINLVIQTDKGIVLKLEIDNKTAMINQQQTTMDVPAKLVNGRTMVPIRFISESFGCKVNWDPKAKQITIIRHDMSFNLWLGVNYAMVGGKKQPLDSPPIISGGRTLVPLRFISEPFGAKVNWEAKTKKITVVWDPS